MKSFALFVNRAPGVGRGGLGGRRRERRRLPRRFYASAAAEKTLTNREAAQRVCPVNKLKCVNKYSIIPNTMNTRNQPFRISLLSLTKQTHLKNKSYCSLQTFICTSCWTADWLASTQYLVWVCKSIWLLLAFWVGAMVHGMSIPALRINVCWSKVGTCLSTIDNPTISITGPF
jgi:hypothetical protein